MKQIENDSCIRQLLFDSLDKWIPHIHSHRFDAVALFVAELIEKLHKRLGLAIFANKDDSAAKIIQHQGQIPMALAYGDLVYG